jgi:hypothetical protein
MLSDCCYTASLQLRPLPYYLLQDYGLQTNDSRASSRYTHGTTTDSENASDASVTRWAAGLNWHSSSSQVGNTLVTSVHNSDTHVQEGILVMIHTLCNSQPITNHLTILWINLLLLLDHFHYLIDPTVPSKIPARTLSSLKLLPSLPLLL